MKGVTLRDPIKMKPGENRTAFCQNVLRDALQQSDSITSEVCNALGDTSSKKLREMKIVVVGALQKYVFYRAGMGTAAEVRKELDRAVQGVKPPEPVGYPTSMEMLQIKQEEVQQPSVAQELQRRIVSAVDNAVNAYRGKSR